MTQYRLSFTGASFLLHDAVTLAKLYFEYGDWEEALNALLSTDVLQRSKSAVRRESREIVLRLKNLPDSLLQRFTRVGPDDAKIILFYAILKTYPIIRSFCLNVLYEKSMIMDNILQDYEINRFFREEEERYEALSEKTESTKNKLKQVMIRILADAGILKSTKEKIIVKPYIDPDIGRLIAKDGGELYLKALLMNETEIASIKAEI